MANLELTWGKCTITYKANAKTVTVQPKIDSTKLTASEGAKQEAKIEGGEVIAVRRDRDSYTLTWQEHISPTNVETHRERIDKPDIDVTDLTVAPDNTSALSIVAAAANVHHAFAFDTQGGILIEATATFVKTQGKAIFELKAGTASPGA